jgi:hypothetical protein
VIYNSNILLGTTTGLFISTDDGATWTSALPVSSYDEECIAVSGNTIVVGGQSGGSIYISTNGGVNWTSSSPTVSGFTNDDTSSILIQGANIYVGYTQNGIYLRTNNGANWSALNTGLVGTWVHNLVSDGTNIFAAMGTIGMNPTGTGVFLLNQNNNSWTSINDNLGDLGVNALYVDGNTLYCGSSSIWHRAISNIVGINETQQSTTTMYPNPSTGTFTINSKTTLTQIQITDISGRVVFETKPNTVQTIVNLQNQSKGIYQVKLVDTEKTTVQKIVLQ